jgi:hypothetical protein
LIGTWLDSDPTWFLPGEFLLHLTLIARKLAICAAGSGQGAQAASLKKAINWAEGCRVFDDRWWIRKGTVFFGSDGTFRHRRFSKIIHPIHRAR